MEARLGRGQFSQSVMAESKDPESASSSERTQEQLDSLREVAEGLGRPTGLTVDPNGRVRELFDVAQSMAVTNGAPMTTELHETGVTICPRGGEEATNRLPALPSETTLSTNGNGNGRRRKKEHKLNPAVLEKRQRRQENMSHVQGLYKGKMYSNGQKRG